MQATAQPHISQPRRPVYGPFDPAGRLQAVQNIINPLLRVHRETITPTTPTRSFPDDNIVGVHDSQGKLVLYTTSKTTIRQDCLDSPAFIGSNPVEVGSSLGMVFYLSCYGRVGARVEIPHATLRLIGSPRTPESTSLSLRYIDGATILHLLRHSVQNGRPLQLRPFRFDGSFRSNNPVLEQDDLVLQVVCSDTGASVGVLDDRIIPSRPVLSNFWP
ncbi:hypothetical protein FA13DRAFT_1732498 [Coprinellus micaceus]|uniref:Uncharacterized protein n=1 Tax=Coprinellus micaceus TaxID=71717 RepID=A0A4Y7TBT9_COPMI|nr:hypothetical protein FA13DRAFT_1732498 [Coprinellus micaceus]